MHWSMRIEGAPLPMHPIDVLRLACLYTPTVIALTECLSHKRLVMIHCKAGTFTAYPPFPAYTCHVHITIHIHIHVHITCGSG